MHVAVATQINEYHSKEVLSWQNVQFVEKELISEIMSAILIEDPTECGNPILNL